MVDGVLRIDLPESPYTASAPEKGGVGDLPCFVAGPENRLPIIALEQLLTGASASHPAPWANPLFLIGPSGSGKSTLAHAIVRRWLPLLGAESVAYFTAVDLARRINDVRVDGELQDFVARLSRLKILVLEDFQKLPAKIALHHQLRVILDRLLDSQAIVLCTSQIAPTTQPQLESGLRDRLGAGLLLWLKHPGTQARLELLRLAAVERGRTVDERLLHALAQQSPGPVQQLLSALRELDITPLAGQAPQSAGIPLPPKEIVAVVARYFNVTQSTLRGPSRRKSLVFARSVTVYLLRTMTGASYAQIGQELGKRDHSTVMHAMESLEAELASDTATQFAIEELRRILLAV